jgi:hypothetical protein
MPWTETTRPHYERRCPRYASDLTDEEWAVIEPPIRSPNRIWRPRKTDLGELCRASVYRLLGRCAAASARKLPAILDGAEILLPLA